MARNQGSPRHLCQQRSQNRKAHRQHRSPFLLHHSSRGSSEILSIFFLLQDSKSELPIFFPKAKIHICHCVVKKVTSRRQNKLGIFFLQKDEVVESLIQKYNGSQADRVKKAVADAKKMAEQLKSTIISGANVKIQHAKSSGNVKSKPSEAEIYVSRFNIHVGLIKKVQKHPNVDSLYIEEIDLGEESTRNVVSGLVKYIPIEEMQHETWQGAVAGVDVALNYFKVP